MAAWTLLYTLCGIVLFYLMTRLYRKLLNEKKGRKTLLSVSILLSFPTAYLWGLCEPTLSWLINPEIHTLDMKWDINSRGTISITFVLAFFSLLYIFTKYNESLSKHDAPPSASVEEKSREVAKIPVDYKNSIVLLPIGEIKKISVHGNYSTIIDIQNRRLEAKKTLKKWEEELDDGDFLRIHRSTIINRRFIEKINPRHNHTLSIKMIGLDRAEEASRRYTAILKKKLDI